MINKPLNRTRFVKQIIREIEELDLKNEHYILVNEKFYLVNLICSHTMFRSFIYVNIAKDDNHAIKVILERAGFSSNAITCWLDNHFN